MTYTLPGQRIGANQKLCALYVGFDFHRQYHKNRHFWLIHYNHSCVAVLLCYSVTLQVITVMEVLSSRQNVKVHISLEN